MFSLNVQRMFRFLWKNSSWTIQRVSFFIFIFSPLLFVSNIIWLHSLGFLEERNVPCTLSPCCGYQLLNFPALPSSGFYKWHPGNFTQFLAYPQGFPLWFILKSSMHQCHNCIIKQKLQYIIFNIWFFFSIFFFRKAKFYCSICQEQYQPKKVIIKLIIFENIWK